MSWTQTTYNPFCYHQIDWFIQHCIANGARSIRIHSGALDIHQVFNPSTGMWEVQVNERTTVWANTRRFYRSDFMFFRFIYSIFSSHGLRNHWWECCEIEEPIEEVNPGDTYQDLMPFIGIANNMNQDKLQLVNFADELYMNIIPTYRNRRRQDVQRT